MIQSDSSTEYVLFLIFLDVLRENFDLMTQRTAVVVSGIRISLFGLIATENLQLGALGPFKAMMNIASFNFIPPFY